MPKELDDCVKSVMADGKTEEEAYAICKSKLKLKSDMEFTEIKGKEIAYPGTFMSVTGKVKLTDKDIDDMLTHFNNGEYSPYLNLDHNDKLTDKVKKSLEVLRLGTVDKLYKVGKKLVADFKQVPKKIASFIDSGLMDLRSIEYSKNFNGKGGKPLHNVLKAVSFFGADVPAIAGLGDAIPTLYEQQDADSITLNFQNPRQEETKMSEITISKEEYKELLSKGTQVEKLQMDLKAKDEKIELLEKDVESVKAENKEFKANEENVEKMKAEAEKKETDLLKSQAETYIDSVIADKKLLPKFKEMKVAEYIRLQSDEDALKLFKEELESRGAVVNMGEPITGQEEGEVSFKQPDYSDDMSGDKVIANAEKDMDNAEKAIEAHMKLKGYQGVDGWMKACTELGVIPESDVALKGLPTAQKPGETDQSVVNQSIKVNEKFLQGEVN